MLFETGRNRLFTYRFASVSAGFSSLSPHSKAEILSFWGLTLLRPQKRQLQGMLIFQCQHTLIALSQPCLPRAFGPPVLPAGFVSTTFCKGTYSFPMSQAKCYTACLIRCTVIDTSAINGAPSHPFGCFCLSKVIHSPNSFSAFLYIAIIKSDRWTTK